MINFSLSVAHLARVASAIGRREAAVSTREPQDARGGRVVRFLKKKKRRRSQPAMFPETTRPDVCHDLRSRRDTVVHAFNHISYSDPRSPSGGVGGLPPDPLHAKAPSCFHGVSHSMTAAFSTARAWRAAAFATARGTRRYESTHPLVSSRAAAFATARGRRYEDPSVGLATQDSLICSGPKQAKLKKWAKLAWRRVGAGHHVSAT